MNSQTINIKVFKGKSVMKGPPQGHGMKLLEGSQSPEGFYELRSEY